MHSRIAPSRIKLKSKDLYMWVQKSCENGFLKMLLQSKFYQVKTQLLVLIIVKMKVKQNSAQHASSSPAEISSSLSLEKWQEQMTQIWPILHNYLLKTEEPEDKYKGFHIYFKFRIVWTSFMVATLLPRKVL